LLFVLVEVDFYVDQLHILCCCGVGKNFFVVNKSNNYNMGDSDDEADKRNVREKFKHERSDYDRHDSRKSHDTADRYMFTPRAQPLC